MNKVNNIFILFLSRLIYCITYILPKFNWLIIQTYPIWEDNGVAVYEYIKNKKINKIIWLIPDKLETIPFEINNKTIFLKRNSIKAVFYYMFSHYIFLTHGIYFPIFPKNQISINLWHGMPLKRIGIEKGKSKLITTYTLSTGVYFNKILAKAFCVPENSVLSIGLPRNISFFSDKNEIRQKLSVSSKSKIIFWLPTYRKSKEGDIRIDGIDFGNVFNMPNFDKDQFCKLLEKLDCYCFLKPHPMTKFNDIFNHERLKIINDDWLYKHSLTLYEALSACDIMISDISSVIVDFLLLDKPILISFSDKDAYVSNRGITTESFFDNIPGPFCITQSDLHENLLKVCKGQDDYSSNRLKLKYTYHGNTEYMRCLDNLIKIMNIN